MNLTILIPVGIVLLALLIFLVARNIRDARKFRKQVMDDYPKPRDEEGDIEIDEKMK